MAKKLKVAQVDPKAISIRSMAPGQYTWLFDSSSLEMLQSYQNEIKAFCHDRKQAKGIKRMETLASKGWLVALDHEPEIVDADGVPGLDLVVSRSLRKQPPRVGLWYDRMEAVLALPTGQLSVAYDRALFTGEPAEVEPFEIETIALSPGFYRLSIFTRVYPSEFPCGRYELPPDLAIYVTKEKLQQRRFRPAGPTVSIYPDNQDLEKIQRKLHGVPEPKPIKPKAAKVAAGIFEGNAIYSPLVDSLQIPMTDAQQTKFGFQVGAIVEVSFGDASQQQTFHAIIAPKKGFHPKSWAGIDKLKRKFTNLAYTAVSEGQIYFPIIKASRKSPLEFSQGVIQPATMRLLSDSSLAVKPDAKTAKQAKAVRTSLRQPIEALESLVQCLENADNWSLALLFERRKRSYVAAVSVHPPQEYTDRKGRLQTTAAGIDASWGRLQGTSTTNEQLKSFRGYPAAVFRALRWIHHQAQGSVIWTDQFQLEINAPRRAKVDRRRARQLAKQVMHDAFVDANERTE